MSIRHILLLLFVFLALADTYTVAQTTFEPLSEATDARITKISFRNWTNLNYDDLSLPLSIRRGDILSPSVLQRAIGELYARNIFQHVDAVIYATRDGVEVEFLLSPALIISGIEFVGNVSLDEKALRRMTALRPGIQLDIALLSKAKQKLQRGYIDAGHFDTSVAVEIVQRRISPYVSLTFHIDEGRRSRIQDIVLEEVFPNDIADLKKAFFKKASGAVASTEKLTTLTNELLQALRNEGYLEAYVKVDKIKVNEETRDVEVTMEATVGDPLSIIFLGNTRFTAEELLAPLQMKTRAVPFTDSAIPSLTKRIVHFYQQHGYFLTTASYRRLPDIGQRRRFEIIIHESPFVRLENIKVSGNFSVPTGDILDAMKVKPAGFGILKRWRHGFITQSDLSTDIQEIEKLYQQLGFTQVEILHQIEQLKNDKGLQLSIEIRENPRQLINSLDLVWKNLATKQDSYDALNLLTVRVPIKHGSPLNVEVLKNQRAILSNSIAELGYPNVRVELFVDKSAGFARYEIYPGERIKIGKVITRGNVFTHDYVIRRELKVDSGDFWSPLKVQQSEQALYQLGFFRTVSIGPLDNALDSQVEDVYVDVRERDTGSFEFGGELSSEDGLHVITEARQRNFAGTGNSLGVGLDAYFKSGHRIFDTGRARSTFTVPYFLARKLELYNELFALASFQHVHTFSYDRLGAAQQLRYLLSEHLKYKLGYTAYYENLSDVPEDIIIGERDVGDTIFTVANTEFDLDFRDDLYNPTSGGKSVLQFELSHDAIFSEASFWGVSFSQSIFYPLRKWLVWANSARIHYLEPFGDTDVIPLSHRLFLGGRNSLRGFSPNSVGPRGLNGNIAGGDLSLVLNTELQFGITESIIWTAFFDAGQSVIKESNDFDAHNASLSELRYSPGIGLRYKTPIGALGIEYGFVLNREFGERLGRLNFNIGNAF
ncbi:MAG: outer membrane protein assembly factor BamA [Deltaproteobacteria bacterium]|nr:outer membrane protein assembly factor BamA [Deltaproteobacteria bacterium]